LTGAGRRHLQGCYADLDSLASSLAVLERQEVAA
jgi:gamma-butyrobetaine dioxygenase